MDWNKIRKDYIAGKGSYRELAAKYSVPLKTLSRRAKDEGWPELRKQSGHKAATQTADSLAVANGKVDTTLQDAELQEAAVELIGKAVAGIRATEATNAKSLKAYSGLLRDLKEVLRSDLDAKEQEARIAKLRAEAEKGKEDGSNEISIELGGAEEWAK